MATVSPTQSQINNALVNFLKGVLPPGVTVVRGQTNRVGEPRAGDFVVFFPLNLERLSMNNIDEVQDCLVTGSIAGTTLTVTVVDPRFPGKLSVGLAIFGPNVADGTTITAFQSGAGGIGTYTVSPSQTAASGDIAAGTNTMTQKTEVVIQCDVHGDNSSDNVQVISTVMRDDAATAADLFNTSMTGVAPLYADNPRQIPFINGEQQYETRWIIDLHLQVDRSVIFAQQFADAAVVDVVNVDATYPP